LAQIIAVDFLVGDHWNGPTSAVDERCFALAMHGGKVRREKFAISRINHEDHGFPLPLRASA
jgi:hypothetical protein